MILGFLRKAADAFLETLYPSRAKCLSCGDETGCEHPYLCEKCRQMLKPSNIIAGRDEWRRRGIESVSFVYYYGKPIKGLIRAFKFDGIRSLGKYMAEDMTRLFEMRCNKAYDLIIPIPLHPARLYERGFNQAEVLARQLSENTGIPLAEKAVRRIRKTKQQAKLSRGKRAKNLQNAFVADGNVRGKNILLIDDVITTGSTICACAEALKAAGAAEIRAMSAAGTHYCHFGAKRRYRSKKKKSVLG